MKNRAFSERPLSFIEPDAKNALSLIMDIAAIETGNRTAREYWQKKQIQNLAAQIAQRSPFWKQRINIKKASDVKLSDFPAQTRGDVIAQFKNEGPLIRPEDRIELEKHSTSGSSGTPVTFYLTNHNIRYNRMRGMAQYFMEDRDLSLNRTRGVAGKILSAKGIEVIRSEGWMDPLKSLIRTGASKSITYHSPDIRELCKELESDAIGYLIAQPRIIETVMQATGPEFFRAAGTAMVIAIAETADAKLRTDFASVNIPVRANYSCEEFGMIASECENVPGSFHVATSNVVVEVEKLPAAAADGMSVGRVLVTHLHSYATPFIRYDLGDIASLSDTCPCGHDGPALSNIHGRKKSMLKHRDGRLSIFYIRGKDMAAVAPFDEYRIRQTGFDKIVVEIGGRDALTPDEKASFTALIKHHAGVHFDVDVVPTPRIDWGASVKRLGFINEILE